MFAKTFMRVRPSKKLGKKTVVYLKFSVKTFANHLLDIFKSLSLQFHSSRLLLLTQFQETIKISSLKSMELLTSNDMYKLKKSHIRWYRFVPWSHFINTTGFLTTTSQCDSFMEKLSIFEKFFNSENLL